MSNTPSNSDSMSELDKKKVLKDVVVSRVPPCTVTEHPAVLHPSFWDFLGLDYYVATVVFYRLDATDPSHFSKFSHAVKTSLSKAVSVVYPMAGTWVVSEDAWVRKLACNDEGPLFVEAKIDDDMDNVVNFDQFEPVYALLGDVALPGFKPEELFQKFEKNDFPSLIVQVTGFKCGGIALTLNYNHMTVDAFGFNRFLKVWSEILATNQMPVSPCCDRSLVLSLFDCSGWMGITPDMDNSGDQLGERLKKRPDPDVKYPYPVCARTFSIRREVIESLQEKARKDDPTWTHFSEFACITATLWRCVARIPGSAEGWSSEDYAVVVPVMDSRVRWRNPQMPEDFIGNLFFWNTLPLLTRNELENQPHSFAARKIHECLDGLNHEKISAAKIAELVIPYSTLGTVIEPSKPVRTRRIFSPKVSSWLGSESFYELDFGCGKPFCFFPNLPTLAAPLDYVCVFPAPPGSNVGACMRLHFTSEIMKVLLEDPEFRQLVS